MKIAIVLIFIAFGCSQEGYKDPRKNIPVRPLTVTSKRAVPNDTEYEIAVVDANGNLFIFNVPFYESDEYHIGKILK